LFYYPYIFPLSSSFSVLIIAICTAFDKLCITDLFQPTLNFLLGIDMNIWFENIFILRNFAEKLVFGLEIKACL